MLTSTKTDDLSIERIADTVRLRVLQSDSRYCQISLSRFWQSTGILGHNDGVKRIGRNNLRIVAVLLESYAEYCPGLLHRWDVLRVDLEDKILASLLFLEDLQCFRSVAWRDDTIRNFATDDLCRRDL